MTKFRQQLLNYSATRKNHQIPQEGEILLMEENPNNHRLDV